MTERLAYSLAEAGELLGGVSRSHIYRMAERGELRLVHLGHRTLVPHSEIERLVDGWSPDMSLPPQLRLVKDDDG